MILDRMSITSPGPKLKRNGLSCMSAGGRPGVGSTSKSTLMKSTLHNIVKATRIPKSHDQVFLGPDKMKINSRFNVCQSKRVSISMM